MPHENKHLQYRWMYQSSNSFGDHVAFKTPEHTNIIQVLNLHSEADRGSDWPNFGIIVDED